MRQDFKVSPLCRPYIPTTFFPGTIYEYIGTHKDTTTRLVLCTRDGGVSGNFEGIDLLFKIDNGVPLELDGKVSELYVKEYFRPFEGSLTITQSK